MVAPAVEGIDLFKIAGRSISGWIPSLKTGSTVRQPFCSQLEERLLLWLEYHPLVKSYARGDIGPQFATAYRLPIPKHAPFAIGYTFEDKPHHYLPDAVGTLTNGQPFIAEAGMEDDKRGDRNLAKAEAARRLARLQRGVFWIGTERTLTKRRHYNLVYLHARRKTFPAFADIAEAIAEVWPWGEMVEVAEVASRLEHQFPANLVEAAIWKMVGDSAAQGYLLVDLEQFTLDRALPLALLPPDAPPLVPGPLPDTLEPPPVQEVATISSESPRLVPGPTFDASTLPSPGREQFHRNLRAVEQVLAGAKPTQVAKDAGIPCSTLSRLVKRTKLLGPIACVPYGSYRRSTTMHPAFQECIRRLYLLPTRLSMTAIREHTEMQQVAMRLSEKQGKPVKLPSYAQVRKEVHRLGSEPELVAVREGAKSVPRERSSAESFVLSIPAPALLTQVDEHTMDLYVVTPDGTTVASRVHAAVLICVKTAAILGAVLALGPLKEEDYMRLVKQSMERKDHLVGLVGCEHSWPCFGKPAIIFHDRGKIFTSERARQVLVDRLGMITEQAPPYAPSAKGTVESLFRWMTERFEKRLPNSSYGVHDAETAAQAGGMTLEELERYFYQAIVDDYQQDWDGLRQQRRCVLWEQAVAASSRKRRSAEIRASEQARQWDRQRQDIHPAEVAQRLASIEAPIPKVVRLSEAVPDADPDRPVRVLPVRTMREEPLP